MYGLSFKKIAVVLAAAALFVIGGCLEYETKLTINEDNSADLDITFFMDAMEYEAFKEEEGECPFKETEEEFEEDEEIEVTRISGEDKEGLKFSMVYDELSEVELTEVEEEEDVEQDVHMELGPGESENLQQVRILYEGEEYEDEMEKELLEDLISMEFVMELPVEPESHNAGEIEDRVLTWQLDMFEDTEIIAEYETEEIVVRELDNGIDEIMEEEPVMCLGRYAGQDRYETAVEISKESKESAQTVVIARGDDFPDAISGVPLAYEYNAPILLTRSDQLMEVTVEEIERLEAEHAIILGGTAAITESVEQELANMGLELDRIGGENRYHTSRLIDEEFDDLRQPVVVEGTDFRDALIASPYAAQANRSIILSRTNEVPEEVLPVLQGTENPVVLGEAVGPVEEVLEFEAKSINNPHHYTNSVEFVEEFVQTQEGLSTPEKAFIATGEEFPDALAGGVMAAEENACILMVDDRVPPEVADFIRLNNINEIRILGGTEAVSEQVEIGLSGN